MLMCHILHVELQVTTFCLLSSFSIIQMFFFLSSSYMARFVSFQSILPSLLFTLFICVTSLLDTMLLYSPSPDPSRSPPNSHLRTPTPFPLSHFLFVAPPVSHPYIIYLSVSFAAPRGSGSVQDLSGYRAA